MMKTLTKTKRDKDNQLRVGQKYYALFQMIPASRHNEDTLSSYGLLFGLAEKEKWNSDEEELIPDFVCICGSLAAVAEIVRQDPSEKYAVIAGTFSTIEPHVQVFMGGVNMNTLQAEGWDGE